MKEIKLSQGKVTLVDDSDYESLSMFKWSATHCANGEFYAIRSIKNEALKTTIYMHRFIMSPPNGMEVDHIDGNGLNNQRSNLRICTHAENLRNRGVNKNNRVGLKGVTVTANGQRWNARIKVDGKLIHLGTHDTPEAAAAAYRVAELKYFGEFAQDL